MGVVAYEMATGTLPFEGASMPALLGAMLRGKPASPLDRQPTLPPAVAGAILQALSPAPADRPETKELARAMLG
jgi:serine/threonine-protein kinase